MEWGRHKRHSTDSAIARFMSRVVKEDSGCWRWAGALGSHKRYGSVGIAGRSWLAHRAAWFLFNGEDPGKMNVCHKCDNGLCVNPEHLFIGTQRDNVLDMEAKARSKHPSGEQHGRAKLTSLQAEHIRSSTEPTRALARQFGVSPNSIARIKKGIGWVTK